MNENQFLSDLFSLPDDWNFRRSFYSELSENGFSLSGSIFWGFCRMCTSDLFPDMENKK
ncbi:hypothetical protein [Metabacillus idriensis]|uniref:hypothetical protein n=1 Tax=Metabacillus idriensis TaxID=324768 RepID=UPI00174C7A18|nr:hypothetical protein [Metabacillus idriensis]